MTANFSRIVKLCSVLLGISSYTCMTRQVAAQEKPQQAALLWEISGNGLQAPSYLFGTIHFICEADYIWTDSMQKAFDGCSRVALEMDMDDAEVQAQLTQSMTLPKGMALKDYFSDEQYQQLSVDLMDFAGIPVRMIQHMRPFAVLSILSFKSLNCPAPQSYELKLTAQAAEKGKEVIGLEQAADQIAIVDKMEPDSLAQLVLKYASQPDSLKHQYSELIAAYKHQDIQLLHQLIAQSPDYELNLEELLYRRNRNWAEQIGPLVQHEPTFIAVGAGHLAGEEGVIALLRKKGFTLTPLN